MVDALNMLELEGIPLVTAIDEHGTVHSVTSESIEEEFVARDFVPPQQASEPVLPQKPDLPSLESATEAGGAEAWGEYGAALYAWGGIERVDEAVAAFRHAVSIADVDGRWHFRLGVCLRRRYDSTYRQVSDFQEAVDEWGRALALDPNQYIWRRRIQQYGPRLDKPYPFYDWIVQAREEIEARGGSPVRLVAEPVAPSTPSRSRVWSAARSPRIPIPRATSSAMARGSYAWKSSPCRLPYARERVHGYTSYSIPT